MKTNMRSNLIQTCLLATVLFALPAVVQAQFNYTTNNGAITITGYTGSGGDVTIPDNINGLPVTIIGAGAFMNQFGVGSVTIPDSVTNIGNSAFQTCFMSTVVIGNGVIGIRIPLSPPL
jgi:BspA type Leucine rich repeat region (6 copies)